MFSQGAGLSQLTCELPGDSGMEYSETQREPVQDISEKCVQICKDTTPVIFESRLKQLEKKRLGLQYKIQKQVDEKTRLLDMHEQRKKRSLDLQMNIEEISEKYQNELLERQSLYDKYKYYFEIVEVFKEHYSKSKEREEQFEKDCSEFTSGFENCSSSDILIKNKRESIKQSLSNKIENEISQIRVYREDIDKKREMSVNVINTCANQNDEAGNKVEVVMKKVNAREKDEEDLLNTYNDLTPQIKSDFEEVPKLQQQLNECMMFGSTCIQNLKLKLNTEQNINANLGSKYSEREDSVNISTQKKKELNNLTLQLKTAVEDLMKTKDSHIKKHEEYMTEKIDLSNKIESLGEGIHKLKDIKDLNKSIKTDLLLLEENIERNKKDIFEVDEVLMNQRSVVNSKEKLLNQIMSEYTDCDALCNDLQNNENVLNSKMDELKVINNNEKQALLLRNKNMEEKNNFAANEIKNFELSNKKMEDSISTTNQEIISTKLLIEKVENEALQNIENLKSKEVQLEDEIESLLNYKASKQYQDEHFDITICEAIPLQKELPELVSREVSLRQAICDLNLSFQQELNEIQQLLNAKILAIEREMELHASVVDSLIKAEDEATNKMKVEIKATEDKRMELEKNLSHCQSQLSMMKMNEQQKRLRIIKTEKKLRTINKEVKVTREDINDAINGRAHAKPQVRKRVLQSTHLMTPTSSNSTSVKEPASKKMSFSNVSEFKQLSQTPSQMVAKRWMESVPVDEYDFSEWNQ